METYKKVALLFLLMFVIGFVAGQQFPQDNETMDVTFYWGFNETNESVYHSDLPRPLQPSHTSMSRSYNRRENKLTIENVYCEEIQGNSMFPSVATGNTICWKPFKDNAKEGDIVVYTPDVFKKGEVYFHRIESIYDDTFVIRGDLSDAPELVQRENIKGIVVSVLYT